MSTAAQVIAADVSADPVGYIACVVIVLAIGWAIVKAFE